MSTFLQLLRIGFWMLPVQRALTLAGAALCVAAELFDLPFAMPGSTLPIAFLGVALMVITPLLAGGAFFRMLSSPRVVLLYPHGKGRLLAGMIGVAMLATLVWIGAYYAAFLRVPPKLRPDLEQYALLYALTLSFATQCSIGVFIASRGPLWALVMIGAWQAPGLALGLGGVDVPRLLAGPWGLVMPLLAWVAFGTWYLKTRRVNAPGWIWGAQGAVIARVPGTALPSVTRAQAMTRWVLGSSTPARIGSQWLLGAALLIGVQLVLGRDSPPRAVTAMLFGTLSLSAVVIGAVAATIAGRSRGLWLTAGRSRLELHAWCERLVLRVAASIALAFAVLGALVWTFWMPRPSLPAGYLLLALFAPGLGAAWFGRMQLHRRVALDALGGLLLVLGWYYGLVQPLITEVAQPRWGVLGPQLALTVLLREVALVRWRGGDWTRSPRVEPVA